MTDSDVAVSQVFQDGVIFDTGHLEQYLQYGTKNDSKIARQSPKQNMVDN
jgi:hypothetical protein